MDSNGFFRKWKKFFEIVFSPGSVIPLILSVLSLSYAASLPLGAQATLFSIIATTLSAVAGFFINEDWQRFRGSSVLEKKGRSAIRNLSSIGQQIADLREWIRGFVGIKKITKRELEEVDRHLITTELNVKSGLEDWIDIVPELKEGEQVSKQFAEVAKGYVIELLKNREELLRLLQVGGESEEKEKLEKRIKELEKSVQELNKDGKGMIGVVPTSTIRYPRYVGPPRRVAKCSHCSKVYLYRLGDPPINRKLCSNCREISNLKSNPTE